VRPLDPRLLRRVRAARRYVALSAALGTATAALVVAQGVLLAAVIAGAVAAASRTGPDAAGPGTPLAAPLAALAAVVLARAAVAGAAERFGHRAATSVVGELRGQLVRQVAALRGRASGPGGSGGSGGSGDSAGEPVALATLATRGLEGLDGYLTKYLPQLLLTCTVTPAVLAVIWWFDRVAGLTVTLTLPLVPLFMALVGLSTRASADRGLRSLQRLSAQLLDLVGGLPTLRAHGIETAQAARLRDVGDAHRRLTMRTLRSAFLSSLVLETLTTISVALVAVGVGLRLVAGGLDLRTGLTVLVLAPEVYLPLRLVGLHYHASVDGLAAAGQALDLLDRPLPQAGTSPAPDLRHTRVVLDGVTVVHPGSGRATPAGLDLVLRPGEAVALVGPSGCGKSTAVRALLGLDRPTAGAVLLEPVSPEGAPGGAPLLDLAEVEPASWARQVAWVPQRPALAADTVEANLALTGPVGREALEAAARATGFDAVVAGLPDGWATRVGTGGVGLSAGQRQLLALTRALCSGAPLVVLDEPTAHLDAASESCVLSALAALRAQARTVLLVAHRPALAAIADRTVLVGSASVAAAGDDPARDSRVEVTA
jgi:ATP-binding cassette subfamily C protein CydD